MPVLRNEGEELISPRRLKGIALLDVHPRSRMAYCHEA